MSGDAGWGIHATPLERKVCVWPRCFHTATYMVWGEDGGEEGEFCLRHAQAMVIKLKRDGDVTFDYMALATADPQPAPPTTGRE